MPTITYSEHEFNVLHAELIQAREKVAVLEAMRPVWAMGFTEDGRAASGYASALCGIWKILQVTDQTQAMQRLRVLLHVYEHGVDP
jgi:hypothetical protein